jgi:nitrite reductase/ring-hydroxylating ferredoxin subunit
VVEGVADDVWVEVCAVGELAIGETRTTYLEGKMVGLFNLGGTILAINNRCTHARGPLTDGMVNSDACTVICPWHYGKFDLRTGAAVDGVVRQAVETYQVEIRDDRIFVGRTGAHASHVAWSQA